jgi:hypothetical protein
MLYNASLYRDDNGVVRGVVAVGRDITRHYVDRVRPIHKTGSWRTVSRGLALGIATIGFVILCNSVVSHIDAWNKAQLVSPVSMVEAPYLHLGDHRPMSILHAGDMVFSHISTQRNVPCFAVIHQRILSLLGDNIFNRVVWADLADSAGYTEAGSFETDYRFIVPTDLPPNHYVLERNTVYTCGPAVINQTQPLIPFTVVK